MSRRRHRRPQGPPLGRQAGLYVAARRPRPASTMCARRSHVLPPQPPAKTNMFAHAPHAPRRRRTRMAREWGGLDRDVFSRAAAARCLGSSEGCPARPVVSLRVDGRPIPSALRHRRVLERLWSKRGGRRPPWDLLRLPARGASARREPRRPTPGHAPRRPAAACRWSHGEAGRVAQRGRAVLPGG